MYEKTQRDVVPVEMVQSSSELEGHPAEEEGLLEGVHEMEERVMRDRMIGLIQSSVDGCARHWAEVIADHLLANGVIVPPFKVGDTVYFIITRTVFENKVMRIAIEPFEEIGMSFYCRGGYIFDMSNIGRSVFFSREDAERALRGGDK